MVLQPENMPIAIDGGAEGISDSALDQIVLQLCDQWIWEPKVKRLLLLPPDHTRLHSFAGVITQKLWQLVGEKVNVDILPALGTHKPMTTEQLRMMFGQQIPLSHFIAHDWINDLEPLGTLSKKYLADLSQGKMSSEVTVAVNRRIVGGEYDLVLSIGQVVPHEVIGFANYTKNVCIGCGGGEMLHQSHFLGAVCGIENVMGEIDTPIRRLMDTGFNRYVLPKSDIRFLLTVVEDTSSGPRLRGFSAGSDQHCFQWAAELSKQVNVIRVDKPLDRCVVYLDPLEFSSTWLGNKSIYRTRKAMADGGELFVLAPAVDTFGEASQIDKLIRKYGYRGTDVTLDALDQDAELAGNLSAAAHLIHGSTEDRFSVTYCTSDLLTHEEVAGVGYNHESYEVATARFGIENITDGWQEDTDGQPFYFIRNPALGLWEQ